MKLSLSSLATRRLMMVLLGAFAVLALVLASVGLYGVMALTVTQRTRELGIRMALGAERTNIFKLVLGQGMTLIAIGIGIGLIGAIAAGRALMSLLYNVGRNRCRGCDHSRNFAGARRADRLLRASSARYTCRSIVALRTE
jgi:ABC-type antimicrobial peptide transport system permease subunit